MRSTTRTLTMRRFVMAATTCFIILTLTPHATLAKTTYWTNAAADDKWSSLGNWRGGIPTSFDIVIFDPVGGTSTMDIAGLNLQHMNMTGFSGALGLMQPLGIDGNLTVSGLMTLVGNSLDVGGNITVYDYLDATGATVTVGGDLTLGPGATLDMGDGTLEIGGNLDLESGISTWIGGGTLRFNGDFTKTWSAGPSSLVYANVEVGDNGWSNVELSAPGDTVEVDQLVIQDGKLDLYAGGLWVHGTAEINTASSFVNFDPYTLMQFDSTVVVNGSFMSQAISGCVLRFAPGAPGKVDVGGTGGFHVSGTPDDRTFLEQDGMQGGSQWMCEYDPETYLSFEDVLVQDSYAQPGTIWAEGTSISGGNTTNWTFPVKSTNWTGAGSTYNWSDFLNWDNGAPATGDDVSYDSVGGFSVMDIPGLTLQTMDMNEFFGALALTSDIGFADYIVQNGTMDMLGHTVTVGGYVIVEGDVNAPHATLDVGGDLDVHGTIDGPDIAIHVGGSIDGSGGGVLDITASTLDLEGHLNADGGPELVTGGGGSGGTIIFNGSGTQNWNAGSLSWEYDDVEVTGGGGGGQVILNAPATLIVVNNLLVSGGTLEIAGGDLEVNGAMTVSSGASFENNINAGAEFTFFSGVSVDGGTFRSTAYGCALYFAAGAPGTVDVNSGGKFEVSGDPYDRTRLFQDGVMGGPQWILSHGLTDTLTFVDVQVQDSYAQPGTLMAAGSSADFGNNTNWSFPQKETIWTGYGGTDNWSDINNWDNGLPGDDDDVYFMPVGGLSVMDISPMVLGKMDMTGFTGDLTLLHGLSVTSGLTVDGTMQTSKHTTLVVVGNLAVDGDLNADSTQIMVFGGNLDVAGTYDGVGSATTVTGNVTITGTFQRTSAALGVGWNMDVLGPCIVTDSNVNIGGSLGGNGGGVFDMTGATVNLDGHLNAGGGLTLVSGGGGSGGTLNFTGSGTQNWTAGSSSSDYANVEVGANVVLNAPGTLIQIADLRVMGGTLEITDGDLQVTGNTAITHGGSFENNTNTGATLRFDGGLSVAPGTLTSTADACTLGFAGGTTISGTLNVEGNGSELRFAAGDTVTVNPSGTFKVIGGSLSDRAKLRLDGDPHSGQWHLDVQSGATTQFENIGVQDSDASPGETCTATGDCVDLDNNDNWNFVVSALGDVPPPQYLSLRAVPNPFNPSTALHYGVPSAGIVTIRIYGVRGDLVRTVLSAPREPGVYMESWDGRDNAGTTVATGLYLCRIESNGASVVKKLVLLK